MSGTATPVTDESGVDLGIVSGLRDVEDLVQAREAAQAMAAIVELSDDAIVGATPNGIITSWNPAAERMYGCASEQIVGTSVIHRDMTELEHAALYARSLIEAGLDPLATIST